MTTNTRIETDSMGSIEVSQAVYWGAQTQRSLKYFSIGSEIMPIEVIQALALIKKASALVNTELGLLNQDVGRLIAEVSDEILSGQLNDHFPLHVWMTGSGTQSNMNVNEVISNRAIEKLNGILGSKKPIHPNDHVNMSQSSNDAFPTAMNIATLKLISEKLLPALRRIEEQLHHFATSWTHIIKLGRTHLQDAVPMTLGQEFSGYAKLIADQISRLEKNIPELYELALGGTAIGTGLNTHRDFATKVAKTLAEFTGFPLVSAANKFAVQGSHDGLVQISGVLKNIAGSLFKIAQDIRLLSCGPRAGIAELILPENEPGSSIMPGKVNPTQCEALSMVCLQVMGADMIVGMAGAGGILEMNVYKPVMIFNIIQSIHLLSEGCNHFTDHLLSNLQPNLKNISQHVHQSLMLVTALSPRIGYDKASMMAHWAFENEKSLREANEHFQYLPAQEFEEFFSDSALMKMCYPS